MRYELDSAVARLELKTERVNRILGSGLLDEELGKQSERGVMLSPKGVLMLLIAYKLTPLLTKALELVSELEVRGHLRKLLRSDYLIIRHSDPPQFQFASLIDIERVLHYSEPYAGADVSIIQLQEFRNSIKSFLTQEDWLALAENRREPL